MPHVDRYNAGSFQSVSVTKKPCMNVSNCINHTQNVSSLNYVFRSANF